MDGEDPSTNGGVMVIVISSFIMKQIHIKRLPSSMIFKK
jgi:hypothetical protein